MLNLSAPAQLIGNYVRDRPVTDCLCSMSRWGGVWEAEPGCTALGCCLLCLKSLPCGFTTQLFLLNYHPFLSHVLCCHRVPFFLVWSYDFGGFSHWAGSIFGEAGLCAYFPSLVISLWDLGGQAFAAGPQQSQGSTPRWQGLHAQTCVSCRTTSLPLQVPPTGRLGMGSSGDRQPDVWIYALCSANAPICCNQ